MANAKRRRSYEAGHQPKFMVVVDDSAECDRAVHFAARRAARLGARMILLAVAAPPDEFEWIGVGDTLRAEAEAEAGARLSRFAAVAQAAAPGIAPQVAIRTDTRSKAILDLIQTDEDISFLVLAAGAPGESANPLVTELAARAAAFPVPIVIVPGGLSDAEIEALAG